jgi:thiol-disulfide isomerase/thioredoxin
MAAGIALVAWSGWKNWSLAHAPAQPQQIRVEPVPPTQSDVADDSGTFLLRGKQAPAFTLVDLDGKRVSLSDFKGHPLLINYWGTYCGPCRIEMPWLQEFSQKYAASGFKVVGITYDSEVGKGTIARATKKLGVTYPILLSDPTTEKSYLSGTGVLPMSFYVDRTGKVIEVSAGQGSKDDLELLVKETIAAGS